MSASHGLPWWAAGLDVDVHCSPRPAPFTHPVSSPYAFIFFHKPAYTFIYFHIPPYTSKYLHIPPNIQYEKHEGQHETQKWSYLGPQALFKSESFTQCVLVCFHGPRIRKTDRQQIKQVARKRSSCTISANTNSSRRAMCLRCERCVYLHHIKALRALVTRGA